MDLLCPVCSGLYTRQKQFGSKLPKMTSDLQYFSTWEIPKLRHLKGAKSTLLSEIHLPSSVQAEHLRSLLILENLRLFGWDSAGDVLE